MSIKAILFDLDGTLLPMDLPTFQKTNGRYMFEYIQNHSEGYVREEFSQASWAAIYEMKNNDGTRLNLDAYYEKYVEMLGDRIKKDFPLILEFYKNAYEPVKESCGFHPEAGPAIRKIKESGARLVLATTPWFPADAIRSRITWAGVDPDAFEFYTTFENSHYCKPNLGYYQEILDRLGLEAKDCLMVGNDVKEDMVAAELGMPVFLMTEYLINKEEKDISTYPQGTFKDLIAYIDKHL